MTTPDDELLALARKATPGPWETRRARYPKDGEYDYAISAKIGEKLFCIAEVFGRVDTDIRPDAHSTAAYIAAANPSAIIAMHERHRAEVERLTGEVIGWRAEEFSARDRAESAEAEVERLTRERDEAREMHRLICDLALHRAHEIEAAESALAAAQKRVGELEAALKEMAPAAIKFARDALAGSKESDAAAAVRDGGRTP